MGIFRRISKIPQLSLCRERETISSLRCFHPFDFEGAWAEVKNFMGEECGRTGGEGSWEMEMEFLRSRRDLQLGKKMKDGRENVWEGKTEEREGYKDIEVGV
uniref:Uncharacterized protein n=1 Tax=Cacopsylla melanoneura TaxID=428564 RepID=A0A8D8TFA6_9HEMI